MGLIRLLAAPIRRIVRFPLFQFVFVVVVILLLQAADTNSMPGRIFDGLDKLVDATVRLCSGLFQVKSFTRSWLTLGLMIAYVYLICLLILFLVRLALRMTVDLLGWSNVLGLRNTIAKERGIVAYRAWLPLERIRPGRRHSHGLPIISRHIRRCRIAFFGRSRAICFCFWPPCFYYNFSPRFQRSVG
jgi:hypothetical protein